MNIYKKYIPICLAVLVVAAIVLLAFLWNQSKTTEFSDAVRIDIAQAAEDGVVSISEAGTYVLNGTLAGQVVVSAPNEAVTLILDGVSITSPDGPAVVFASTSESHIVLADGSENTLEDVQNTSDLYDAALYSVSSMELSGDGSLTVHGTYQEGIASEMHLTFNGGTYNIISTDDGLNANNDGVSIITINSGNLHISAGGDGIDSNGTITINGGTVVTFGSLSDMNGGLDADGDVTINGGTVFATGARNSYPVTSSNQKSISATLGNAAAGSVVTVRTDGSTIYEVTLAQEATQVVFSSADIQDGVTYDVSVNGELVASVTTADRQTDRMMGMPPEGFEGAPRGMGSGTPPEFDRSMPFPGEASGQ